MSRSMATKAQPSASPILIAIAVFGCFFGVRMWLRHSLNVTAAKNATPVPSSWNIERDAYLKAQLALQMREPRHLPIRSQPVDESRHDSYPLVSGDTFRAVCHWTFDEAGMDDWSPSSVRPGDLIFVKTDRLAEYFLSKHPFIVAPYILITSNSDNSAPEPYLSYLNDSRIVSWYSQNANAVHPRFHPLPIGFANRQYDHGNLSRLVERALSLDSKSTGRSKLFINVRPSSNAGRTQIVESIKANFQDAEVRLAFEQSNDEYLADLGRSTFVLSPAGNGIDCHRTWEALLMGAVPVVQESLSFGDLQLSSPTFVIDDFLHLGPTDLQNFVFPSAHGAGVFANHWYDKFENDSASVR